MTDDDAGAWDEIYSHDGRRAEYPDEFVVRFVNGELLGESEPASTRVLDLGCGPGRHVAYLAQEGFETYGVDYSSVAVDMARDLCRSHELDIDVREADFRDLPFEDGFFDAVIDCASLQHNDTDGIAAAVSEIHRVLAPGGVFFSKGRSREDSFFGEGRQQEPGTFVFHQESVVTDEHDEKVEKPTHFFSLDELDNMLAERFDATTIEYTERTFNERTEKIAHYVVTARR